MGQDRLIDAVKQFNYIVPEVPKAAEGTKLLVRVQWTVVTLLIYLVCCHIPLYGIRHSSGADPLAYIRMMLASNRNTLMELGISPIITSGMVLQLLKGVKLIDVGDTAQDRRLFNSAQKLLGMIMTLAQAVAYVLSGMYGTLDELGSFNAALVVLQLFGAGVLVIVLDEMLQKGHGIGSGINLFIATSTCENIVWDLLSPQTINVGNGTQIHGALIAVVHLLRTRPDKMEALYMAFFRPFLPNLTSIFATAVIFFLVVWLQRWRVSVPRYVIQQSRVMEHPEPLRIRLFYASNMPIILQGALMANLFFFSQLMFRRMPENPLVRLLGVWSDEGGQAGRSRPTGGMSYYISAPGDVQEMVMDPFRTVFYIVYMLFICALFASLWIMVSGTTSQKVAEQHLSQEPPVVFVRALTEDGIKRNKGKAVESMKSVLDRYIPTAARLGGMAIGALSVLSDFMGARGSGTSILLAVTIIDEYAQELQREREEMQELMSQLFGGDASVGVDN